MGMFVLLLLTWNHQLFFVFVELLHYAPLEEVVLYIYDCVPFVNTQPKHYPDCCMMEFWHL